MFSVGENKKGVYMNFLKKNQVLLYVIAFMLVAAGYLNYTAKDHKIGDILQTTTNAEELAGTENIGDARLVSSQANDVPEQNNLNATNEIEATANISADDYFSKSRLERDTMYSQMIESYENVLNGINALETQKQSASEEIKKINNTKNSIMICENLIATKGYNKCVVFVNGESVSAIIGAQELKQEEISQIQNILSRELNAKIENIHISLRRKKLCHLLHQKKCC